MSVNGDHALIFLELLQARSGALDDQAVQPLADLHVAEARTIEGNRRAACVALGAKAERLGGDQLRKQPFKLRARQRVTGIVEQRAGLPAPGAPEHLGERLKPLPIVPGSAHRERRKANSGAGLRTADKIMKNI